MPISPRLTTCAFHVFTTLGVALALYLTLLKLTALPCSGLGDCGKIIHSSYGNVFRIPVGAYALMLWVVVLFQRDSTFRALWLVFLAASSVGFMVIQFAVLRGFCLYCTLHALCTWAALALFRATPKPWLVLPVAILLASGGFAYSHHRAHILPASPPNSAGVTRIPPASGLPWLAPVAEKCPILIISLDCPSCLELLEKFTRYDFTSVKHGPAIFFKTTPSNRALTREFIAAILAQKELPVRDALLATTTLLITQKDLALSRPDTAAQALASFFPHSTTEHPLAEKILDAQAQTLATTQLPTTTPLLLTPDGGIHSHIDILILFTR
jgi:uncharacterized membrane protein